MFGVDFLEIVVERSFRHPELANDKSGKDTVPSFQPQPTAGAAHPVAHHVNVHVDPHEELIAFRVAKVHFSGLPTQRGGRNQILQPASCHAGKGSPRLATDYF